MIVFRALKKPDAAKLLEIYGDRNAMRFKGSKPMSNLADAKRFIENQSLHEGNVHTLRKGVALTATGELIGSAMFRYNSDNINACEIGYSIGKQYWSKGFGTEIVKRILQTLQKEQHIHRANAWSHKENIASIKILVGLGFVRKAQSENEVNDLFVKQLS